MNLLSEYVKYFKYQCEIHPKILHKDDVGDRCFAVIDIEEALGEFRTASKEKGVMFRAIIPFWNLPDEYSGNSRVAVQGGFIVAKYHSSRETDSVEFIRAMDESKEIALDFAEKMVADSQNGHPLFHYSINSIQHLNWNAQPRTNIGDGSYSGYLCTFTFQTHFRNCLAMHDDENWKQPTPHI